MPRSASPAQRVGNSAHRKAASECNRGGISLAGEVGKGEQIQERRRTNAIRLGHRFAAPQLRAPSFLRGCRLRVHPAAGRGAGRARRRCASAWSWRAMRVALFLSVHKHFKPAERPESSNAVDGSSGMRRAGS